MKRTLISILCFVTIIHASGQQVLTEEIAEAQTPINIGLEEVNKVFTPPAVFSNTLKSGGTETGKISVTYVNFPEEVKATFEYAVSIWEKNIFSPVQINITANWESLPGNVLANGKPSLFCRNFKGAPLSNIYYPVALVEKITGKEFNNPTEADITCYFNKSKPWFFGTNGKTPDNQYDFVTAVLHEIGHGLGISGFFTFENGIGKYSNSSSSPSIYDYFVFNANKQRIADQVMTILYLMQINSGLPTKYYSQVHLRNLPCNLLPIHWFLIMKPRITRCQMYLFMLQIPGKMELAFII